ncbi:MAG: TetR family transcriptional regulator [Oscillospiraceae bacterium]
MKTDARVKYTKMVLKKALLELMQHKPVNKITVKEICERAELNRATFYAHYSDCFDLLESIEEELFGRSLNDLCRAIYTRLILRGLWVGFTGSFRKTRRSAVSCCSGVEVRS